MTALDIPRHMYIVALEEYLLLEAFRALLPVTSQGAYAPAMTMYSRNELVHYAMQTLTSEARETFLQYADVLAAALPDCSDITFPPPPAWTSLAINVDNQTEPHVDRHNGDTPSLLLGVSHHTAGDLWTATPNGRSYMEISNRLIAGTTHPTSAAAVLFDGRNVCHATCSWSGGNRITMVAYTVQRTQRLPPDTAEYLENLGFVLPR
eukprot:s9603_g2.t1